VLSKPFIIAPKVWLTAPKSINFVALALSQLFVLNVLTSQHSSEWVWGLMVCSTNGRFRKTCLKTVSIHF